MSTVHLKESGPGLLGLLFGTGTVTAQCGAELPTENGPVPGPITCDKCLEGPKLFLGLF